MHAVARIVTHALALGLFVGCSGSQPQGGAGANPASSLPTPPPADVGSVLATVNGQPVGSTHFSSAAERVPFTEAQMSLSQRQEVLKNVVDEEVLFQQALTLGLYRDPKVRRALIQQLQRQEVFDKVSNSDFSQEELQTYYEAHKDEFTVPEKVHVYRIFLRIDDRRPEAEALKTSKELRARIAANPSSFGAVAAEHSEDVYRRRGGDLGFVAADGKPGIDPAVVEQAFKLPDDGLSEVFVAGGGVNIVRVAGRRERIERTFDQMKGNVLRKLKTDRYNELLAAYVQQLRDSATITTDDKALADLTVTASGRGGHAGLRGSALDGLSDRLGAPVDMIGGGDDE